MALSGTGTLENPFLITSIEELVTELTDKTKYYKVTKDLTAVGTAYEYEWPTVPALFKELDFDNRFLKDINTVDGLFKFPDYSDTVLTAPVIKNAKLQNINIKRGGLFPIVTTIIATFNFLLLNCSISCYSNINRNINDSLFTNNDRAAFGCLNVFVNFKNDGIIKFLFTNSYGSFTNFQINLYGAGQVVKVFSGGYNVTIFDNVLISGDFKLAGNFVLAELGKEIRNTWIIAKITGVGTESIKFGGISAASNVKNTCFYVSDYIYGFDGFHDITNVLQLSVNQARSYDYLTANGFQVTKWEA